MIEKPSLKNAPKSDHKDPAEIKLELLEAKLRTMQLALEVLTGTCATLPELDVGEPEAGDAPDDEEDDGMAEDKEGELETR
jgi:hypothetical protein